MPELFLQELKTNPRVREIISKLSVPKDEKESAACYVQVAKELGYSLKAEDILASLRKTAKAQAEKTDEALKKVSLESEDLDPFAGGRYISVPAPCEDTYSDGE